MDNDGACRYFGKAKEDVRGVCMDQQELNEL
jgi:hypothetical protein